MSGRIWTMVMVAMLAGVGFMLIGLKFGFGAATTPTGGAVGGGLAVKAPAALDGAGDAGDLVQVVTGATRVGVLLDEVPAALGVRDRVAADMLAQDDGWWETRSRKQLAMTTYKLQFLSAFDAKSQQMMLPADDPAIRITFLSHATRHSLQGHDVVSRPYTVQTYLVVAPGTAIQAHANLGQIDGEYTVKWFLPLDPYLVYQRSGYACADEDQFPHNSLDSEAVEIYYDDTCTAGPAVPPTQECDFEVTGCHCTQGAALDCPDALRSSIGAVHMSMTFSRQPWDESIAQLYESRNSYAVSLLTGAGADLIGNPRGMRHNWVVYRYFEPGSCESLECIAGAGGWRKLLVFDSIHVNVGRADLSIGHIKYTARDAASFDQGALHNMYYWDPCHQHPHFSQYCKYLYSTPTQTAVGHKQGFCIQSTNRIVNSRAVSMVSPFQNCSYQGVSPGWADNYNGGIPCQWVDITPTDTNLLPLMGNLTMVGNPSGWLCEGRAQQNADGSRQWRATGSLTGSPPYPVAGLPIDVFNCSMTAGALDNNVDDVPVLDPAPGQGLLTAPCSPPGQIIGPKRDCGFTQISISVANNNGGGGGGGGPNTPPFGLTQRVASLSKCPAGASVSLNCSANGAYGVVRVCEASAALLSGTACRYNDDFTLSNVVLPPGGSVLASFRCPAARDAVELGGLISVYGAALYPDDPLPAISCTL